jgi:lysozyme
MTIIDQLKRDEGVRLRLYKDSVGKFTIGVGRNLEDVGISADEADLLLANDVAHASRMLETTFPWTAGLSDARHGVLLNMTFNMGIGGLGQFRKFLADVQAGNYDAAAQEMLNSAWAREVGPRAQRLSIQMQGDNWQ